jgi:hypothetical protein
MGQTIPGAPGASHVAWLERQFQKARAVNSATEAAAKMLVEVCNNPHMLLTVVAAGREVWQVRGARILRGFGVPDTVLDLMWAYMAHRAGPEPAKALDAMERRMADHVERRPGDRVTVTAVDREGHVIEDEAFDGRS